MFEGDCIIGHEAAGVVLRCGEGVEDFKPGMPGIASRNELEMLTAFR